MVIDMNESQVRTVEQVRQVVAGTQRLDFKGTDNDAQRYAWIGTVLQRLGYRTLASADRGVLLVYLQHLSGYSRAQTKRLVARWCSGAPLVKCYHAPAHAFARRYTPSPTTGSVPSLPTHLLRWLEHKTLRSYDRAGGAACKWTLSARCAGRPLVADFWTARSRSQMVSKT